MLSDTSLLNILDTFKRSYFDGTGAQLWLKSVLSDSAKVVSMDSGNNHSQNTPVRAEYERQITPIITFIWVQPGPRLVEQAKVLPL